MSNILPLAQEIAELERQLSAKKAQLSAQLQDGHNPAPVTASRVKPATTQSGPSTADRVRRFLGGNSALSFGELWEKVARGGGTKFALKSALNKGRERGEFAFDAASGKYAMAKKVPAAAPKKKAQAKKAQAEMVLAAPPVRKRAKKNPAGQMTDGVGVTQS